MPIIRIIIFYTLFSSALYIHAMNQSNAPLNLEGWLKQDTANSQNSFADWADWHESLSSHDTSSGTESTSESESSASECMNTEYWKLIHFALNNNEMDFLQGLLADVRNGHKTLALDYAVKHKLVDALKIILADTTISINHKDRYGRPPLHYAAGKECVARKLWSNENETADVTENKHTQMVKLFIDHKDTQVNLKSDNGETALDCAEQRGYTDIATLLRKLQ